MAAMIARTNEEEKQMLDINGSCSENDSDIESLVWRTCKEIVRAQRRKSN